MPSKPKPHESARERWDRLRGDKEELELKVRRGELVPTAEVKTRWTRRVIAFREAALNLVAVAIQRGIVARDQEAALQGLVDEMLKRLKERQADA